MLVYLGLGSNEGDRVGNIQQAMRFLTDTGKVKLLSVSSLYETEPIGFEDQDWFVNAACAIETSLTPEALLEVCQDIEKKLGRDRQNSVPNGPRPIDIDILFYGNLVMREPNLTIPHPHLHERAFALVPLLEVNSRLVHPILQKSVEQLHDELENPEEVFLYGARRV